MLASLQFIQVPTARTPWYRVLYFQVLIAVALGIVCGFIWPYFGKSLKPLGDVLDPEFGGPGDGEVVGIEGDEFGVVMDAGPQG